MDDWTSIDEFEGYEVSRFGQVRNSETGRVLTILRNGHGTCYVGMMKGGQQLRRSIAPLVANAFIPKDRQDFNGLIHVDGYQHNNRADNLMWRPHWFVVTYLKQIARGSMGSDQPVIELKTRELYPNTWDAALAFGLIEKDLISSILNRTFTWPTFQEFRYLAE